MEDEVLVTTRSPTAMILSWAIARRGTECQPTASGVDKMVAARLADGRRGRWREHIQDDTSTSRWSSTDRIGDPQLRVKLSISLAVRRSTTMKLFRLDESREHPPLFLV